MINRETGSLRSLINSPCFYGRYFDDIVVILDSHTDADTRSKSFNRLHLSIHFTVMFEKYNMFNISGGLLSQPSDGSVERPVYRKPTLTVMYEHFKSFDPLFQKRNLIHTLTHRGKLICSADTHDAELLNAYNVLKENAYSERFITRDMATKPNQDVTQRKPIYITLPSEGGHTADRLRDPVIRNQKLFVQALQLPWPHKFGRTT